MKNKKTKLIILTTFFISLILSLILFLFNTLIFKENFIINWPIIDTEPLSQSINTYEGDFDKLEFEEQFNKQIETNIPKETIDIEYTYDENLITIELETELENYKNKPISNPYKKYLIKLDDKLMV